MSKAKRRNPKAVDDDNPVWTKEDFKRAWPATTVLPALIGEKAANALFSGRHEQARTTPARPGK